MARVTYIMIASINIFMLLVGITILIMKHSASCFSVLYGPLIILGPLLIVVSLLGLLGLCCSSPFIMWIYLVLKFIVILGVAFGVFLDMFIMVKGVFKLEMTPAVGTSEMDKLYDYAHWLQSQVAGVSDWQQIQQCLVRKDICSDDRNKPQLLTTTNDRLFGQHRDGCCKPPSQCGFEHITNSTEWRISTSSRNDDPDCSAWSNERSILCYNCKTCKAGFLADLTLVWGELFPVIAAIHIILVVLFVASCQAFRHLRTSQYEKKFSIASKEQSSTPDIALRYSQTV